MTDEIKKQVAQAISKKIVEEIFDMDEIHELFEEAVAEYMDEVETAYVRIDPSHTGEHEVVVSFLGTEKYFIMPLELPVIYTYGANPSQAQREGCQEEINALRRLAADISKEADKAQESLDRSPPR